MVDVDLLPSQGCELGEGPAWIASDQTMKWVDIMVGEVLSYSPDTGQVLSQPGTPPISAVFDSVEEGLVVIDRDSARRWDSGVGIKVASVELAEDLRFNDATCDLHGRIWAGTLSISGRTEAAALYCLEPGGEFRQVADGIGVSNGIGFNPDGDLMYHVDSATGQVTAYDFDLITGDITRPRPFASIPQAEGVPDGLCVDTDGGVWIAFWQAGEVRRFAPDGSIDRKVGMPMSCPTSVAFGGRDLEHLYVTSSLWGARELGATGPADGRTARLDVGVRGLPVARFGHSPEEEPNELR